MKETIIANYVTFFNKNRRIVEIHHHDGTKEWFVVATPPED